MGPIFDFKPGIDHNSGRIVHFPIQIKQETEYRFGKMRSWIIFFTQNTKASEPFFITRWIIMLFSCSFEVSWNNKQRKTIRKAFHTRPRENGLRGTNFSNLLLKVSRKNGTESVIEILHQRTSFEIPLNIKHEKNIVISKILLKAWASQINKILVAVFIENFVQSIFIKASGAFSYLDRLIR